MIDDAYVVCTGHGRPFRAGIGLAAACAACVGCSTSDAREATASNSLGGTDTFADMGEAEGGDAGVGFGEEQEFELRLNEAEPPPLTLAMDRDEVAELFGDTAKDVLLLEVESTDLLTNTLNEIKLSCGTDWQLDDSDPNHDCSLTALGQSYVGPGGDWTTSPEYSLVRILTMTPANVVVEGTSLSGLQGLADFLNIGGGFGQIMADALGLARTEEFVSTANLVTSLQKNFLATHPGFNGGSSFEVTLEDALTDMATLADRYGPIGAHPGVLSKDFPPSGVAFGPDFQMTAIADSNLLLLDGVDLSDGKEFINTVVDNTGPTYTDPLEFDFTDPQEFSMEGIVDQLQVDLRFAMPEDPTFVETCLQDPCKPNLPGNPIGNSVWAREPWTLEYVVAEAAKVQYQNREYEVKYLLGSAEIRIGKNGDPKGWVEYDILLNLGNPPQDQYTWESIMEVAQVALHEPPGFSFAEGDADVAFTLEDVEIGLDGAEVEASVRPYLQDQASELANYLLGDYKKNNAPVEFYLRRADDGNTYLFFVAPEDLDDTAPYEYVRPGFFASAGMDDSMKASATEIPGVGDTVHEKLAITAGETVVYAEDDTGTRYRIRVVADAPDDDEIQVFVAAEQ